MKSKIKLVISLVALFMLPAFITGFENEETYGDTKFKDNVVFYVQHQDDETLWASAAIIEAINEVGVKRENVILLPRINNSNSTSFDLMESQALKFEKELKSVTHVAHTYKLDWHLQHLKNGAVIQSLYNAGKVKDVKYFVKPQYEKDIPTDERIFYKVVDDKDKEKIRKACGEYKLIDKDKKREGIGYKSDHKSFERLMKNYDSILHTANI